MRKKKNRSTVWLLFAAAFVIFAGFSITAQDADKPPIRVFRLGNSHTNSVKEEFLGIVGASGHRNFIHDQHTVPGAPIRWLWFKAKKDSAERLEKNHWDVLIFQTYNSTIDAEKEAIVEYTRAARKGNPKVRVILYTIWPSDKSLTLLPGDEWFNKEQLAGEWGRYEGWTEEVAAHLKEQFPDLDVAVAPTSLVIRMVGGMADAGFIPGMTGYNDLTQDAGHMGLYGGYAIGCTFCAMIWNESPIGYPAKMLKYTGGAGNGFSDEVVMEVKPEAALAIQKVIWDILAEYEHDGVDTGLWINSGRMIPALLGKKYDRAIPVVDAAGDVSFELKEGSLPKGLELRGGRISGTPTEKGMYSLTLQASDGKMTVKREILLPVEEELPMKVPDVKRELRADEYIMDKLKAEGAIGKPSWKVTEGKVPNGLLLLESGLIKGTPAEQGTFEVTVQAVDRHPEGARTASGKVVFEVGPPSEGTIIVPLVESSIETRKSLAEQKLPVDEFPHEIKDSAGNVVARFAVAAYKGDEGFRKKRPEKFQQLLYLVKGVKSQNADGFPMESVHIYLDTNHNLEVIYNEDDEHWMFRTKAGPEHARRVQVHGYRPTRHLRSVFTELDDGWILAVRQAMPAGFGVHNLSTPVTYGMNIAVGSEKDPKQRYYWKGDARSDKDTSVFGSILIKSTQK